MSARNEDAMRGGIAWLCETGHVDLLHRRDGNYTDQCATCRDGSVCEPRFTPGRRSKEQRERDKEVGETHPRFEEERRNRRKRREVTPPVPTEIKITRGDGAVEVVDGDAFKRDKDGVEPPFTLTEVQRKQILSTEAKMPDIVFDRLPPADLPDGVPWPPASPGDVVAVSSKVFIVVLGTTDRTDGHVLNYEVRDRRDPVGEPIKTVKPLDPKVAATTLVEQWRPERDGALSRATTTKLAENVARADLERLLRIRGQHAVHLEELASEPRDVRWPIRKNIEALDQRIKEVEKQLKAPEEAKAAVERSLEEIEIEERQRRLREARELQQRRNAPGTEPDKKPGKQRSAA